MNEVWNKLVALATPYAERWGVEPTMVIGAAAAISSMLLYGVVRMLRNRRPPAAPGAGMPTTTSPRVLRKQAARARKQGHLGQAAKLLAAAGDRDQALALLVEAEQWVAAAELALEFGRKDKAASLFERGGRYREAAELLEQIRQFEAAGKLWQRAGNLKQAGEMWERLGRLELAAQAFAEGDVPDRAAELYAKLKQYERAASLAEVAYQRARNELGGGGVRGKQRVEAAGRRAAELFERIGAVERAEAIYLEIGDVDQVVRLAAVTGRVETAVEALVASGREDEAADLLERAGRKSEAARMRADARMAQGDVAAAAKLYASAGDVQAAIDAYTTIGLVGDAARVAEAAGRYEEAGGLYLKARDGRKAAECFEAAARWDKAAALWQRLGDTKRTIRALVQGGKTYEAALHMARAGDHEGALKLLDSVVDDERAQLLVADLLLKRGDHAAALKRYEAVLKEKPVNATRLESAYRYALLLEKLGRRDDARAAFKAIVRYDPAYRDVRERYERLAPPTAAANEPARPTESETAKTGARRRRYVILEELGRGGMGVVYKAMDRVLDRIVALKVLPSNLSANDMVVRNFFREAKSAAALSHPNIVTVYDAGEEDDTYYIAMEYIQGPTLKQMVRDNGPFPVPLFLLVAVQTLKGLGYAHSNRIVHRDIKPSNLMWVGHDKLVKITDFGLAKVIQEVVNFQTVVGGTPHYMSPEQILGEEIDARADLYSLGASLYELATGSVPYPKGDAGYHHIHSEPPNPCTLRPDFPPALAEIVVKLMAKDREARYPDADAVLAALERARSEGL